MNVPAASSDLSAVYGTSVQKKTLDQQKVEGDNAERLIESTEPKRQPLPPDATYSVRA